MKDPVLKVCPKDSCRMRIWGKGRVRRLMSAGVGLIFKGSGFYITDYRSDNYKESAKKEKEASTPKKEGESASKKESDSGVKKETKKAPKSSKA
jgi:predicted nucleic acid-binding Zn ribbon protein